MGNDSDLRADILHYFHNSPTSGHSGVHPTMARISKVLFWKGLKKQVKQYVRECSIYQQCKYDSAAYPGLLQPLPIPSTVWIDISMDFIEKLPKSACKDIIMVVVDRLSKYAHFMPLSHPFSALTVVQAFMDNIYRAVKRAGPFNRKNFRVRVLVFSTRLNPNFFGPDRISSRPDWASPRLTGWPRFCFF